MTTPKHTPGPWRIKDDPYPHIRSSDGCVWADDYKPEANAVLMIAAPAYFVAWSMVPEEIKQRIFDALHSPESAWVEQAIAKATGN